MVNLEQIYFMHFLVEHNDPPSLFTKKKNLFLQIKKNNKKSSNDSLLLKFIFLI